MINRASFKFATGKLEQQEALSLIDALIELQLLGTEEVLEKATQLVELVAGEFWGNRKVSSVSINEQRENLLRSIRSELGIKATMMPNNRILPSATASAD